MGNALKKRILSGFSIAELIVVIAILAILATIGFMALSGYSQDAKSSAIRANVRSVYSAITAESTSNGISPRWYVEHSTGASLSGALIITDGTPVTLTGGEYGQPPLDSNYSAGNPRWDRLKMDGEKFRISQAADNFLPSAFAGYSPTSISVGAVDAKFVSGGKPRTSSLIQVAAISPATGEVSVTGNYSPSGTGAASGLIKDPQSASSTGALEENRTAGTQTATPACPSGQSMVSGSCVANAWSTSAWSACSATCGGGTQTRSVTCKASDGTALADSSCLTAKPATSQSCNTGTMGYYCPSGYGWSGLSLDCYSLVSGAVANHMCCKAGSATVSCVTGGASVTGCTATAAPIYGCH